MIRIAPILALLAAAACTPAIQTTSGAAYLAETTITDPAIRAAADIEPNLKFPARIGIARIVNGALSLPPQDEGALLADFAEKHAEMGEWVPLSPLVHAMLQGSQPSQPNRFQQPRHSDGQLVQHLRETAARQHLDYLLIYELGARSGAVGNTPFALADVTIVGGLLLPTRTTRATGIGVAAFIDVRNAYPYGTVSATEDLSGLARTFMGRSASARLRERATEKVAKALMPQVTDMMTQLLEAARQAKP